MSVSHVLEKAGALAGRLWRLALEALRLPEPLAPRQSALAELRLPLEPLDGQAALPNDRRAASGPQPREAEARAQPTEPFAHWAFVHMIR